MVSNTYNDIHVRCSGDEEFVSIKEKLQLGLTPLQQPPSSQPLISAFYLEKASSRVGQISAGGTFLHIHFFLIMHGARKFNRECAPSAERVSPLSFRFSHVDHRHPDGDIAPSFRKVRAWSSAHLQSLDE